MVLASFKQTLDIEPKLVAVKELHLAKAVLDAVLSRIPRDEMVESRSKKKTRRFLKLTQPNYTRFSALRPANCVPPKDARQKVRRPSLDKKS